MVPGLRKALLGNCLIEQPRFLLAGEYNQEGHPLVDRILLLSFAEKGPRCCI